MAEPYFRSICAIVSDFGLGPGGRRRLRNGTGFFFHSAGERSYILTAAHNLYRHELAAFAGSARLWMGREGGDWAADRTMLACRVPQPFVDAAAATVDDDYAVIQIDLLPPDAFAPIGLDSNIPADPVVRLAGYPNVGTLRDTFLPFHGDIGLRPAGASNVGYLNKPSYEGQSGAPLLLAPADDGTWSSCGIHTRGATRAEPPVEERAIRFNAQIFAQIHEWLP